MPSGPKKRKAAKKKQAKDSNNSTSSSTTHSHHGESDGGELLSPAAQDQQNPRLPFTEGEVKKHEDNLSVNESRSAGSNENAGKEEEGNIEIDKGSDDESHVFEKKVVVIESTSFVEKVHPVEPLPEKIAHEVKVSDSLVLEEKVCLVVEETPELNKSLFVDQAFVVNGTDSKDDYLTSSVVAESSLVENAAVKSLSPEENPFLVAPPPQPVKTTSWKGCCGILELFSSSDRN